MDVVEPYQHLEREGVDESQVTMDSPGE